MSKLITKLRLICGLQQYIYVF